jgi:hypothetical protein
MRWRRGQRRVETRPGSESDAQVKAAMVMMMMMMNDVQVITYGQFA